MTLEREISDLLSGVDPLANEWVSRQSAQILIEAATQSLGQDELREFLELIARLAFHDGLVAGRNENRAEMPVQGG